ncbi:group II intron maturase-specific domain-containing protein, partial [Bacillus thuringiensis]|uniref:group II intron maturase-specific domain-containing protein n=1 Tax=Bacillus thuringiensis TaxID=1428 RepID=UPI00283D1BB1
ESHKNAKKKLKEVFDWGKGRETVYLIEKLNRVLQGIANYWSPTVAKVIFRDIDSYVNEKIVIYLKHRHHRTSFRKLMKMYFKPDITGVSKDRWILTCPK